MARALEEIARLDRRWFRAHPERRHRCRWPDTGELDLYDSDRGARLVMAIRHLGRGHVVYQPVIFPGALPTDERSAAALFALAATSPDPIPVIAQMDVLRLRRGLRLQTQSQEASAMAATNRPNTATWAEAGGWRGGVREAAGRPAERSTGDPQALGQADNRFRLEAHRGTDMRWDLLGQRAEHLEPDVGQGGSRLVRHGGEAVPARQRTAGRLRQICARIAECIRSSTEVMGGGVRPEQRAARGLPWLTLLLWLFACAALVIRLVIRADDLDDPDRSLAGREGAPARSSETGRPVFSLIIHGGGSGASSLKDGHAVERRTSIQP
jgi:hypothetical protein